MAEWPRVDENNVNVLAEERENLLTDLIEDTLNVLRATKISPKRICYYTANNWKWNVYRIILKKSVLGEVKVSEVMKELSKNTNLREKMKAIAAFVPKVLKNLSKLPNERKIRLANIEIGDEKKFLESTLSFLEERFKAQVSLYGEEDQARFDPKQRASLAIPGQPAIYIE